MTAINSTDDGGMRVRVGIQSADRLRREALAAYLETLPSFTVVGQVAHHEDVVPLCVLQGPSIMLLDAADDVAAAAATCREVRERCPDVSLALAYERLSPDELAELRDTGVDAVVAHSHGLDATVAVLDQISRRITRAPSAASGLSARQREILLLLASGHNAVQIGGLLGISPGTVENHKRRVYAKLGVTSAVQAIERAGALGLIDSVPAAQLAGTPGRNWRDGSDRESTTEDGRPLLGVAIGNRHDVLDRVVAILVAARLPVVRDHAPSWAEQTDGVRWHRGPVVRILVDPAPDHWRVCAVRSRSTVVVHTGPPDRGVTMAALRHGGAAVVPAEHVEERLIPMVVLAAHGYLVVDQRFSRTVLHNHDRALERPALTGREYDILRSIGRSHTIRQTARSLGIAVKTVENTQGHLFRKLGVHNRAEALAAAYSLGLLEPQARQ